MIGLVSLPLLHKKVKLRYFIFTFTSIVGFLFIPGIINAVPDWAPYGSINDESIVGFSDVANQLETNGFQVQRYLDPINTFENNDPTNALTFFSNLNSEIDKILLQRYNSNLPTIIVGDFGYSEIIPATAGCKYLDYNSSYHSIAHVAVRGEFNGQEYVSITPRPISMNWSNPDPSIIPLLTPKNPSYEICSGTYSKLPIPKQIPIAVKKGSLVFIADDFMLKNNFTRQYPQNLDLLPNILKTYFPQVKSLIVYEWNLNYMPINREGLKIVIENGALGNGMVAFMFLLLFTVTIGGLGTGLIKGEVLMPSFQKKLTRRLERLHTKRIPAVPLSAEETVLLREHFLFRQSGADYFKRVAIETLKFIHEEGLDPIIPKNLLISLQNLAAYRRSPEIAWEVLGKVKYILEVIETNSLFIHGLMSQENEGREISIFDLPSFSERSAIAFDTTPDYFSIPFEKEKKK